MRRILIAVVASAAVLAAAPAIVLAHDGHHQNRHHRRHDRRDRNERRARHEQAGSRHHSDNPGMPSTAGTVTSFNNGVLTITLNDGVTTETGAVTNDTNLKCEAPENNQGNNGDNDGDRGEARDDGGPGPSGGGGDGNGDNGDDGGMGEQNCSTAALTPGAAVSEAELRISSTGAVWHEVELITP